MKGYTHFDVEVLTSQLPFFYDGWRRAFPFSDRKPLVLFFPLKWTLQPASLIVSPSLAPKGSDISPLDLITRITSFL